LNVSPAVFEILTSKARNGFVFPTLPYVTFLLGEPVRITGWNLLLKSWMGYRVSFCLNIY